MTSLQPYHLNRARRWVEQLRGLDETKRMEKMREIATQNDVSCDYVGRLVYTEERRQKGIKTHKVYKPKTWIDKRLASVTG